MTREEQLRQIALEEIAAEEVAQEDLASAKKEEPLKQGELPSGLSPRDMVEDPEAGAKLEAIGVGMGEGVPFAKDLKSALQASMDDNNFGESYTRHRMEWDSYRKKMEDKYPGYVLAGDVLSNVFLPWAKVGNLVKVSKNVAGAISFGTKIKQAAAIGAVSGAVSGASRMEGRDVKSLAIGAGVGATLGTATSATITTGVAAVQKVGQALGWLAAEGAKEAVGAMSGKNVKVLNAHIDKTGTKGAPMSTKTAEFAYRVHSKKLKDGSPLIKVFQNHEELEAGARSLQDEAGRKIGSLLSKADDKVDPIDTSVIYSKIKTNLEIDRKLKSNDPATRALAKEMLDDLDDMFIQPTGEMVDNVVSKPVIANGQPLVDSSGKVIMQDVVESVPKKGFLKLKPSEAQRLKLDIAESHAALVKRSFDKASTSQGARSLNTSEELVVSKLVSIGDAIDDAVNKAAPKLEGVSTSYKALNTEWSDMYTIANIASANMRSQSGGALSIVKRALGFRGLIAAQIKASTGASPGVAAGLAVGLNTLATSPATGKSISLAAGRVSKFIGNNPEHPLFKRIALAVANSESDDLAESVFKEELAYASSSIAFMENPLKRDINSIKNRSDDILNILEDVDKDMASSFRDALQADDDATLSTIIDALSKDPNASKYIESGMGINGKVFSDEDKMQLKNKLNTANIPLKDKLRHKKELREQSQIPKVQPKEDRAMKYIKRDHSKPSI